MGPALLLAHEVEHAYRTAAVKADWARSRRTPRSHSRGAGERASALRGLRHRAVRLLHV